MIRPTSSLAKRFRRAEASWFTWTVSILRNMTSAMELEREAWPSTRRAEEVGLGDDADQALVVEDGELADAGFFMRITESARVSALVAVMISRLGMRAQDVADGGRLASGCSVKPFSRIQRSSMNLVSSCARSRAGCITTRLPGPSRHGDLQRGPHGRAASCRRTSMPSWRISRRAIRNDSRSSVLTHSSTRRDVEDVGDEVVADALDLVGADRAGAGEDRAHGVDADDLRVRELLACRRRGDAGDRAAGAGREHTK